MTVVLNSQPRLGGVLKYEDNTDWGHGRETVTVNATATTKLGSILKNDGDGTYSQVVAADVATLNADVALLVDGDVYDAVLGDRSLAILSLNRGGAAGFLLTEDAFGDVLSAAQTTTVITALEAKGFQVLNQG